MQCAVCSCHLTQQDVELKQIQAEREGKPFTGMNSNLLSKLPPKQQEMYQKTQNSIEYAKLD